MSPARILIVDDEPAVRDILRIGLEQEGYAVTASSGEQETVEDLYRFDVVLLDHFLSGRSGLDLLVQLDDSPRAPRVIMVSGQASVTTAVAAMKSGAIDYLSKPFEIEDVVRLVRRALDQRALQRENVVLRSLLAQKPEEGPLVCVSPKLHRALQQLEKIACFDTPVLITGETGVGKGLMASLLHQMSARPVDVFLQLNCSAFSESLFESELFGHVQGAFTGAAESKIGLFEAADGGTLFLDEVGELGLGMQAKLLHVLDSYEIRPVGATVVRRVDVRIVAATNRDLEDEVEAGRFREDLLYRLKVLRVEVPPLRERYEDIEGLAARFLERFRLPGKPAKGLSRQALEYLCAYAWPGNVRELANLMETLALLSPTDQITAADLPDHVRPGQQIEVGQLDAPLPLREMERLHIIRTLELTGGHRAAAARILGIDVKTLKRKIDAAGVDVDAIIASAPP